MKDQLAKALETIQEYWKSLEPKRKKIVKIAAGGILAVSLLLVIVLNFAGQRMRVLFPKLSSEETTQAYSTLQEMGVNAQMNGAGEILVPADQWGEIQLQMAGKGYPKSAPTYDFFLNNSGFTKTESEIRQTVIYQTELQIREALMQTKGIESASVILSIPANSGYVWETNEQKSSASVTVTTAPGQELSAERVSAIKNLVAFSVLPQMDPENVKVIDAKTGVELLPDESGLASAGLDLKRLEFEARVKKNIEDNVRRLLSPIYGAEGVTAVAWVTLDYDKMLTEQHQIVPEDNGNGVKVHQEQEYDIDGRVPVSGLVGEDQNTDIPSYPNQAENGTGDTTRYRSSIDWQNSYINTQIEKGQAVLKEATVSVVVNDPDFTEQRRADLVELVSKSVNIRPDSITVQNYTMSGGTVPAGLTLQDILENRTLLAVIIACGVALLMLILIVTLVLGRKKKQKRAQQEEEEADRARLMQEEIEQHKRELKQNAQANSKETAITNEVRDFARDNPEITAGLIRGMMKEDE